MRQDLVKPTTGGGIYYSLVSAALAAETLVDAVSQNDLSARRLAAYEERWRERLSAEFHAQTRLRMLAHRMSDSDIEQLFEPRAHRRCHADRAPYGVLQSSPQADSRLVETPTRAPTTPPAPRVLSVRDRRYRSRRAGIHRQHVAIRFLSSEPVGQAQDGAALSGKEIL